MRLVTFNIDDNIVARLDNLCERYGLWRSDVLRVLVTELLSNKRVRVHVISKALALKAQRRAIKKITKIKRGVVA